MPIYKATFPRFHIQKVARSLGRKYLRSPFAHWTESPVPFADNDSGGCVRRWRVACILLERSPNLDYDPFRVQLQSRLPILEFAPRPPWPLSDGTPVHTLRTAKETSPSFYEASKPFTILSKLVIEAIR